jgi:hypothetical protein
MVPRNPSELARLEDEREYWYAKVKDKSLSKVSKQVALMNLRNIEARLGYEGDNYNTGNF